MMAAAEGAAPAERDRISRNCWLAASRSTWTRASIFSALSALIRFSSSRRRWLSWMALWLCFPEAATAAVMRPTSCSLISPRSMRLLKDSRPALTCAEISGSEAASVSIEENARLRLVDMILRFSSAALRASSSTAALSAFSFASFISLAT